MERNGVQHILSYSPKKAGGNITGQDKWSGKKNKWVSLLGEIEEIYKE